MKYLAIVLAVAAAGCEALENGDGDGGSTAREGRADAALPAADAGRDPEADATPIRDAGVAADAAPDAAPDLDALTDTDAAPPADAAPSTDGAPPTCELGKPAAADRDRVVLISHPFTEDPEVPGTDLRGLTLTAAGELRDDGARLDVGVRVSRIEIVPSGELALVLGEDGTLLSVRVAGAGDLEVIDSVELPPADFRDLTLAPGAELAFVVGNNVAETAGISAVHLECDGRLIVDADAFFPLRLTQSMALLPGGDRAVVVGGQAVFEPVDEDDLRLLEWTGAGWEQIGAFDVFHDFLEVGRIGLSPDGSRVLVPNGSPFSEEYGQVAVLAVEGDALREIDRLEGLLDAREARFAPDGDTALLTMTEGGEAAVLDTSGGEALEVDRVGGIGVAEQMAMVTRGALSGRVILPAVDPGSGPKMVMLQVDGPGQVRRVAELPLGRGGPNIPSAVAVSP